MQTAKIFKNGDNQLLQLPEGMHFSGDEVYIQQTGSSFLIVPKDKVWENFLEALDEFPEDYFEAVEKQHPAPEEHK